MQNFALKIEGKVETKIIMTIVCSVCILLLPPLGALKHIGFKIFLSHKKATSLFFNHNGQYWCVLFNSIISFINSSFS